MSETLQLLIGFGSIILGHLVTGAYIIYRMNKDAKEEAMRWETERQKLLDRIQAPSFDHLKHAEVKVIKAQKEQPKETINLEVV